jgi:hypothetical protein
MGLVHKCGGDKSINETELLKLGVFLIDNWIDFSTHLISLCCRILFILWNQKKKKEEEEVEGFACLNYMIY